MVAARKPMNAFQKTSRRRGYVNYLGIPELNPQNLAVAAKRGGMNDELRKGGVEAWVNDPEVLRKADAIGIPPDRTANQLAKLVPENLGQAWRAITSSNEDIKITHWMPVQPVFSTEFKYTVIKSWGSKGSYRTLFIGENGMPAPNITDIDVRDATVRLVADRRTLGLIAQSVGIIGGINPGGGPVVMRAGLQFETTNMLRYVAEFWERALFHGDTDIDPLEFDGVIAQIMKQGTAGLQVHDLRDATTGAPTELTFGRILADISRLREPPYYAKTEVVFVTPGVWASLQISTADGGRWLQDQANIRPDTQVPVGGSAWTFNPGSQSLVSPSGRRIQFVVAPLLSTRDTFLLTNTGTVGSDMGPPVQVTNADINTATAGGTGSYFTTDDAGDYIYGLVYVFTAGSSAGFFTSAIPVAAGESVTIVMDDAAIGVTGTNLLRYVDVWRSPVNGTSGEVQRLRRYEAHNESGHTEIVDDNSIIAGTDYALALQFGDDSPDSSGAIFQAELLKLKRMPIPNVTSLGVIDAACCRIAAPVVAAWERQICWYNVKGATGVFG